MWALVPQRAGLWCHIRPPSISAAEKPQRWMGPGESGGERAGAQARMLGASLFVHCRGLKPQSKRSGVGRGFEDDKWLTRALSLKIRR